MGNFINSNVYGRKKYARFRELSLKSYEMKIQPVSKLKTYYWETFTEKFEILTFRSISINQVGHGFYHWNCRFRVWHFWEYYFWSFFQLLHEIFFDASFSQSFKFLWVTSLTAFPINSIDYLLCRYNLPLWHLLLKAPCKGRLDNTKIDTDLSTKSFLNLQL